MKICETLTNIWQHLIKCGEFWSAFCLSKTFEKSLILEYAEDAKHVLFLECGNAFCFFLQISVLKRSASVQPWTIPPKFATMALHLTIRKPGFLICSPGVKTLEELFLRRHQDPVPVKDNPMMSSQSTAIGGPLGGTPTLLSLAKPFAKPLE